jgi:DNA helicase HerA-like ATPase
MKNTENFADCIGKGYDFAGDSIVLGGAMLNGEALPDTHVKIPLKTLNRHGLIAGATGTGKTKTLQVLSEQLSEKGIPVLLMDVKGDLSGVAKPGEAKPFIVERQAKLNLPYAPQGYPVELMTISRQNGVRLRATVSEFGPILLSRILDLNDTQSGILAVVFKYCDDHALPLLDLKDLKKTLQYVTAEGKEEIDAAYGKMSSVSTGTILRKLLELEQQDAELFFGELSFEIADLMRHDKNGRGYLNIIRLTDIQDKPKLFSTFMLCLLAEIYGEMPEKGDCPTPELIIFIDEAHLIFDQASKALLNQLETIVKLIRSKGVGLYFITQNPTDIPNGILSQLGLKIQHALRAFTAADRKAIKLTAENFPLSEFYKTDETLTNMGTGEALVTALNEKGIPTPLALTMVRAPQSRMDILTDDEMNELNGRSELVKKYNKVIDRQSAYEILNEKIAEIEKRAKSEATQKATEKNRQTANPKTTTRQTAASTPRRKTASKRTNPIVKVVTSASFIRGVMGILTKVVK